MASKRIACGTAITPAPVITRCSCSINSVTWNAARYAAFAAGPAFFGDARRAGAFFASFFLTFVVFLRVVAPVGEVFLRFGLVLPLAFFLVAIYILPTVCRRTTSIPRPRGRAVAIIVFNHSCQYKPLIASA